MVDVTNVILVILTGFSAAIILIAEGFKITLGFRSCEETRLRKQRIDNKLHEELDKEIDNFLLSEDCEHGGPDRTNGIQHWGYKSIIADNISNDLLMGSDKGVKNALKSLIVGTGMLILTIIMFFSTTTFDLMTMTVFIVYTGIIFFVFWVFTKSIKTALTRRELFVKLDENPTLEYAEEVNDIIND